MSLRPTNTTDTASRRADATQIRHALERLRVETIALPSSDAAPRARKPPTGAPTDAPAPVSVELQIIDLFIKRCRDAVPKTRFEQSVVKRELDTLIRRLRSRNFALTADIAQSYRNEIDAVERDEDRLRGVPAVDLLAFYIDLRELYLDERSSNEASSTLVAPDNRVDVPPSGDVCPRVPDLQPAKPPSPPPPPPPPEPVPIPPREPGQKPSRRTTPIPKPTPVPVAPAPKRVAPAPKPVAPWYDDVSSDDDTPPPKPPTPPPKPPTPPPKPPTPPPKPLTPPPKPKAKKKPAQPPKAKKKPPQQIEPSPVPYAMDTFHVRFAYAPPSWAIPEMYRKRRAQSVEPIPLPAIGWGERMQDVAAWCDAVGVYDQNAKPLDAARMPELQTLDLPSQQPLDHRYIEHEMRVALDSWKASAFRDPTGEAVAALEKYEWFDAFFSKTVQRMGDVKEWSLDHNEFMPDGDSLIAEEQDMHAFLQGWKKNLETWDPMEIQWIHSIMKRLPWWATFLRGEEAPVPMDVVTDDEAPPAAAAGPSDAEAAAAAAAAAAEAKAAAAKERARQRAAEKRAEQEERVQIELDDYRKQTQLSEEKHEYMMTMLAKLESKNRVNLKKRKRRDSVREDLGPDVSQAPKRLNTIMSNPKYTSRRVGEEMLKDLTSTRDELIKRLETLEDEEVMSDLDEDMSEVSESEASEAGEAVAGKVSESKEGEASEAEAGEEDDEDEEDGDFVPDANDGSETESDAESNNDEEDAPYRVVDDEEFEIDDTELVFD